MSLAGISIRRPVATTMVMVSFIFIGLLAMFSMKKELIPNIKIPVVTITTTWNGAVSEDVETQVTKKIKDGMFGNVIIPVGESSVLSIEDEAIITRDLVNYVFKYEDGKAKQVEVTVGATNLPYTEISSPEIKEGDKIIVKGLFGLQNNDSVEIKNEVK